MSPSSSAGAALPRARRRPADDLHAALAERVARPGRDVRLGGPSREFTERLADELRAAPTTPQAATGVPAAGPRPGRAALACRRGGGCRLVAAVLAVAGHIGGGSGGVLPPIADALAGGAGASGRQPRPRSLTPGSPPPRPGPRHAVTHRCRPRFRRSRDPGRDPRRDPDSGGERLERASGDARADADADAEFDIQTNPPDGEAHAGGADRWSTSAR